MAQRKRDAMAIEEVARRLGVPRVQLSRILNGRSAISADLAIRIGLLTHTTPESWLSSQAKWDLWQASRKPRPTVQPFRPAAKAREGWAEASDRISRAANDKLVWPEFSNEGDKDIKW